jgi:hypothetical protein
MMLFAMSCHRVVLAGEDSIPNRWGLYWTARETRFVGWSLVIVLITIPLGIVVQLILIPLKGLIPADPLVLQVVSVPVYYVMARFMLILPATAVDQRLSLNRAWDLSRGNGWRLMLATGVPAWFMASIGRWLWGVSDQLLVRFVMSVALTLLGAITVILLSVAFRALSTPGSERPTSFRLMHR